MYSGPEHWNDADMLEIGNGNMTYNEYEAHYLIWSILKSPLLLGCDLTKLNEKYINLLSNEEIIAVNQDPLGMQVYI